MTDLEPEPQPVIRRELYPAKATLPDGTAVALVKLVVTAERVYLFTGRTGDIHAVLEQTYSDATLPPPYAPRTDAYLFSTPAGELVVHRLPGCGCHAQALKHFRPFPDRARLLGPVR